MDTDLATLKCDHRNFKILVNFFQLTWKIRELYHKNPESMDCFYLRYPQQLSTSRLKKFMMRLRADKTAVHTQIDEVLMILHSEQQRGSIKEYFITHLSMTGLEASTMLFNLLNVPISEDKGYILSIEEANKCATVVKTQDDATGTQTLWMDLVHSTLSSKLDITVMETRAYDQYSCCTFDCPVGKGESDEHFNSCGMTQQVFWGYLLDKPQTGCWLWPVIIMSHYFETKGLEACRGETHAILYIIDIKNSNLALLDPDPNDSVKIDKLYDKVTFFLRTVLEVIFCKPFKSGCLANICHPPRMNIFGDCGFTVTYWIQNFLKYGLCVENWALHTKDLIPLESGAQMLTLEKLEKIRVAYKKILLRQVGRSWYEAVLFAPPSPLQ